MAQDEIIIEHGRAEEAEAAGSSLTAFLSTVASIAWKDLTVERHTRQTFSIMAVFSVTAIAVFNFALELRLDAAREMAAGLLWITILLAGTLGLNRSLAAEQENRSMDALLVAPVDRSAIYLGKVSSLLLLMVLLEVILVPLFVAFSNKPFWRPQVLLILFLGTVGYVAAGVLVSSMAVQTRARDVLLPILLLPLTLPAVLSGAIAVSSYMLPELPLWSEVQTPIALLVSFSVIMLTAGVLTYHYVVEE